MRNVSSGEPTEPTIARFAQLETDTFCECGYNLHGQRVTRDERLKFMVCQCPECGRWQPAGVTTSATALWLTRLATLLIVAWAGGLCLFFLGMGSILAGFQFDAVEAGLKSTLIAPDGQQVSNIWDAKNGVAIKVIAGTTTPAVGAAERLVPDERLGFFDGFDQRLARHFFFTAGAAFITGATVAVALWHLHRRWRLAWLLFPFVAGAIACANFYLGSDYDDFGDYRSHTFVPVGWTLARFGMYSLLLSIGVGIGLWVGRPIARLVANVMLAPGARQPLAFLWRVDGLEPPAARHPSMVISNRNP